jgi:hypothetical protein
MNGVPKGTPIPRKPLRIVATHHGDDGIGIAINVDGRQESFVHIPPLRGPLPADNADLVVRRLHDLNRAVQRAVDRLLSRDRSVRPEDLPEDDGG